ncbi:MAG TPA: alpha-galactosidase, partial [Polyangia bacterium]
MNWQRLAWVGWFAVSLSSGACKPSKSQAQPPAEIPTVSPAGEGFGGSVGWPSGTAGSGPNTVPDAESSSSATSPPAAPTGSTPTAADVPLAGPEETAPPSSASRVAVTFDDLLKRRVLWKPREEASVLTFEAAVQPGLRVGGSDLVDFPVDRARSATRRLVDPEFGSADEIVAVGRAERPDGVKVEREVRVLLPDRHPDAFVMRSRYRNVGDTRFRIERVYSERLVLDRKQAEPGAASHAFASYQGAAYAWGKDYALIPLRPGFKQSNFLGQEDLAGAEGVGGGMPLVDLWGKTMGVAVAHVETGPRWVSLPVEVRADGKVEVGVTEAPQARLGQKEWLAPGESYETITSALIFHQGDFYAALDTYGELLRSRGVAIPRESPESAHEPYWKSWGFRKDVTVDKFMAKLPELQAMGVRTANLDDGWYDFAGDWQPNRAAGKFPGGGADVTRFVKRVHDAGFRTAIWWYPLGVSPDSRLFRERPDLLVMDEGGRVPKDIDGLHQLCPGHEPSRQEIRAVLKRMVFEWGFDGVYLDFQGL